MKFANLLTAALMASAASLGIAGSASAQSNEEVQVLHWWTSGGEAKALSTLKDKLQGEGVAWVDVPVAGGGGEGAMTVLRSRVTAGDPPTASQMLGFDIQDWAEQGVLANLNDVAAAGGWDAAIPEAIQKFSKYEGEWVAAPVNIHSTNWIWVNKAMFDELGLSEPKDWDGLIAALDKIKAAGKTALAHGGQPWQDATIFDSVVMTTGGPDFYQKSMIDLDPEALGSDTMKTVFERMAKLRTYVDDNFSGRDWNLATAMVINGEAGVQIMGDWAKGEFLNAGKQPGTDFLCYRFPGTQGTVTFNTDQFAMFQVGENAQDAQSKLAAAIEDPAFQVSFNTIKGSAPTRTDVSDEAFDACGKKAIADVKEAAEKGTLLGSLAHGHAARAAVKNAMYDVVTAAFNGDYTPEQATQELVTAVAGAQ
ncbi:ABC transporter substrate-binding protein [Antarcticirhabdus aurantiaca]|uniref:ABC transporter substrate-binding protein n=1 Tax=Antarcticirhabdus aurantiaca TaxID=2606717 RepID=A0ACD4NH91_9HYPH|nr:ABC transporter substrate-binding protein [Antarcticirhabdus aurantiaca]WAJ26138.1 ABC transporter substrate-binding protein [Jeongeuplla avenae]